jgi:hypothetical protein
MIGSVAALKVPRRGLWLRALERAHGDGRQEEPVQGSPVHGGDHPVGGPLVSSVPDQLPDLECMLSDRGIQVDHTTLFRWIQAYAP